jgi:general stress protein 26
MIKNLVSTQGFSRMKLFSGKYGCLLAFAFLFIAVEGVSQDSGTEDSLRQRLITAAQEIMAEAGTCALITLDEEGRARVRTMDPFKPENDLTVWFATNPASRKVKQISHDPRVTLYYTAADNSGYVMIQGTAQLVNDGEEKERRWKEGWQAFYPDRKAGYLLIRVTPVWMEIISYPHGIAGDPVTWQPPRVKFNDNP